MNTIDHRAYFSRRAAQERRLADAAADCTARHAHREMARCYADLALEAPRVEWPVQSDSIVLSPRAASAGASAPRAGARRVKTAIPPREASHSRSEEPRVGRGGVCTFSLWWVASR